MLLRQHLASIADRSVYSGLAASLETAAADINILARRFVLVVAADTSECAGPDLVAAAAALLRAGASYVCCWGPDCKRLHDCFDEADIDVNLDSTDERFLMTTWHSDEPLEEALWFAAHVTLPASAYATDTQALVAISIGSPEWAEQMAAYLDAGAPLLDEA